ncbi:MAG: hypothetical protein ACYC25_14985, partial [Paludibacter sp.]
SNIRKTCLNSSYQMMKSKIVLKILAGIVAFVLLLMFLMAVIVEPWFGRKIQTTFNKNSVDYSLKIAKVHISIIRSGIELENIILSSNQEHGGIPDLTGEIASINFEGIRLAKALFRNDIDIREVSVFNSRIRGKVPFSKKAKPPKISSLNVRIDSLFFDKLVVEIKDSATAQAYSIKDGVLKIYDIQVGKRDTLSPEIFKQFDFDVQELHSVSADSMYTITAIGASYSTNSKTLTVANFAIHPNYKDYEFTSRHQFETDRIEAHLSSISFHDFSAVNYLKSRSLVSSYIEIGKLEMNVFRDKRKEIRHVNKPVFQDVIYNYPGTINIDSVGILSGNITYIEHAEEATEPGVITFNALNAEIYKITNDTIYKAENAFLELHAKALLMNKGEITVLLKSRLFDNRNTFSVKGSLSGMEAKELNPILEKNAFVYATSGKIDKMNFKFTANNTKARGTMTLLYHGLDVTLKNKRTDDTTSVKSWVLSIIANKMIRNSNPVPGEKVRIGIIDRDRDPIRFLFSYCAKSILSGIKSSLVKAPGERKK